MKTMEEKIIGALSKVAESLSEGMEINDAVAKVASDAQLPVDGVIRLIEAANIAKTQAYMKTASDKTASFPIAEPSIVLKKIFVDREFDKAANAPEIPDVWGGSISIEKTASDDQPISWTDKKTEYLQSPGDLLKQLYGSIKVAQVEVDKNRLEVVESFENVSRKVATLADRFAGEVDRHRWTDFEAEALSEHKEAAEGLLDMIYETAKIKEERAAKTSKTASYREHKCDDLLQGFAIAMENLCRYDQAKVALDKAAQDLDEKKAQVEEVNRQMMGMPAKKVAEDAGMMLDFSGEAPIGDVVSSLRKVEPSVAASAKQKALERSYVGNGRQVGAEVDGVKRQAILKELISNDEVISKLPHADIEKAYNAVLTLAPDATTNLELLRGVLRNASAQQAMDVFSADQLAGLQETMHKNKIYASGRDPSMVQHESHKK
jgi:hypothetical protein